MFLIEIALVDDEEEPRRGYKWEMKNRTDTKIGEDKNTYTYTVRYQD